MLLHTIKRSAIAAAGALIALAFSQPATAEDDRTNLGPVGPHEPILASFGDKRLIAYYEPNGDKCAVHAVVFDSSPNGGGPASARVRVALHPGELFFLDDVADRSVILTCAPNAGMLTVLNRHELLTKAARVN